MDDHGESGSDVEDEKPRSGSSVCSGSPREAAIFKTAADHHAATGNQDLRRQAPENLDGDVEGRSRSGGAADVDDSPADNPRPGRIGTMAPNVAPYANQETTSDRIETVVYSTTLDSTTSACRMMTIDETTTTAT